MASEKHQLNAEVAQQKLNAEVEKARLYAEQEKARIEAEKEAQERHDRMDEEMIEKVGDDAEKIMQIRKMQHEERQWKHEEKKWKQEEIMERLKCRRHEESDEDVDQPQLKGGARVLMLKNQ